MYRARPVGTKIFCLYYRGLIILSVLLREVHCIYVFILTYAHAVDDYVSVHVSTSLCIHL